VAYSTPQEAYAAIIKAFNDTDAGKGVKVSESYGASGDQSRAVDAGQPADYVGFSLEPDISRLTKSGVVAEDWNTNASKGMVTDSVVVFIVRKGNPENIQTWDDLTKEGIEVLNPNVFTSGGARWNVMAAYGAQIEQGKTEEEAEQYLHDLYANIPVQDASARESLQTFATGKGDVLLGYENEAIFAQQRGEAIDYVVPDQTILIENPVALTKNGAGNAAAKAFYDFVFTKQAQEIFLENGYRPVSKEVTVDAAKFPTPSGLFTIAEFGGWTEVMEKFFNPEGSVMVDVERGIGVSVEQ
jgi:sulfate transport system substrate-binding protein